jgi:hypothetical protein
MRLLAPPSSSVRLERLGSPRGGIASKAGGSSKRRKGEVRDACRQPSLQRLAPPAESRRCHASRHALSRTLARVMAAPRRREAAPAARSTRSRPFAARCDACREPSVRAAVLCCSNASSDGPAWTSAHRSSPLLGVAQRDGQVTWQGAKFSHEINHRKGEAPRRVEADGAKGA